MHLETFKTVENIQNTKFELLNSLPAGGLGVINNDPQYNSSYNGITSPCKLIRYAVEARATTRPAM
jgi:UDP-N-acetylmuramoyl-tripeptide--D-alanyl-D-alanine ligase